MPNAWLTLLCRDQESSQSHGEHRPGHLFVTVPGKLSHYYCIILVIRRHSYVTDAAIADSLELEQDILLDDRNIDSIKVKTGVGSRIELHTVNPALSAKWTALLASRKRLSMGLDSSRVVLVRHKVHERIFCRHRTYLYRKHSCLLGRSCLPLV
jgi:hypothetical protein